MTKNNNEINWHSGWRKKTTSEPVKPLKYAKFQNKKNFSKDEKERTLDDN